MMEINRYVLGYAVILKVRLIEKENKK